MTGAGIGDVAGDDVLIGGAGADLLDGGEGADAYWLLDPAFGADELLFVSGEDTLHLAAAGFAELPTGALAPSRFIDDGGAPATGDAVLLYDAATGALSYDADGDGAGDPALIATLRDAPALSAADIVVEALLV
ncbi:hypothetical protein P2H44_19855 [Albimonas sp. CAU 1670]|uniref:hypothetical protein n=1 Tax=Albimonas sp. CAU 1670 TaxID=3032599 RepID=UPI0023DC29B0|nr:hypothetical protein [Albimonas sp. CAU 1670]MDF2234822.1 hypothetical protein [Albimonas sp. CAU 1670]